MINKQGDKKGDKRKQKGDRTDTMTHKKGDKTGDKERMKGDKADTVTIKKGDQGRPSQSPAARRTLLESIYRTPRGKYRNHLGDK